MAATYALSMLHHRPTSLVAFTGAGAAVVASTFLPWLHSGSTSRSSYELLGLLDRLDLAPDGLVSSLIEWWPVVPLLVTVAVVTAWWGLHWVALCTAVAAVAYAGGVGTTLAIAAGGTGIKLGAGPWLCAVSSAVFLVSAVWMTFTHASVRDARTPPAAPPADRS
jgi:hypothetical protein